MSSGSHVAIPPNPDFASLRERLEPDFREILARYESPRSALIPIIRRFQDEEGFVSQQAMLACGELIGEPVSVVESTVSFYTLLFRRPVGKVYAASLSRLVVHDQRERRDSRRISASNSASGIWRVRLTVCSLMKKLNA